MRSTFSVAVLGALCLTAFTSSAFGQTNKPTWVYAHDLKVRKGGESDWDKATKIGVELFKDAGSGGTIAITQAGQLAVFTSGEVGANKKAEWFSAQDLRVRKADEEKFTMNTMKLGVEVFKDAASGKLLYLSQTAGVAFSNAGGPVSADKDPVWSHALTLKVRSPKEENFGKDTKQYGIEVFKDGSTGGLIYITEAGLIATAPYPKTAIDPEKLKAPKALYGLTLRVRKADENDFTEKTQKYGIEVFLDENTGGLIYVSETGSICCVPAPPEVKDKQGVEWKYATTLKARPGGEASFMKANKFGVEAFIDKNTGYYLFISDIGGITVLKK